MFKTIQIIVMAVFCLNFSTIAQENKAIDVTSKGIQIGQKVPDITITNLHNYKDKNGKPATTAKLSDFKGKLLILDFWATWCSPCIAMIPKMDALQKQFGDKIQFLSVTYQSEKDVLPFLAKFEKQKGKHYDLPFITDDVYLNKLFPHKTLPHFVWIDSGSKVIAITGYEEVTQANIQKALDGDITLKEKVEINKAYNAKLPFLINNNGGDGSDILFHSVFTPYQEGISPLLSTQKKDGITSKICAINVPFIRMLRYAYGADSLYIGENRLRLFTADTLSLHSRKIGDEYTDWLRKYGYSYELYFSPNQQREVNIWTLMQRDLSMFFPKYVATVEKVKTKCLVLIRTSKKDKLKTKGDKYLSDISVLGCKLRNASIWEFFVRLNVLYMQNSPIPLVNEANYESMVDLDIDCNLSDLKAVNLALQPYDLALVEKDTETEMLLVRDNATKK